MGANQLRFRSTYLDLRPDTATPVTAKMVEEQLGFAGDVPGQVRAMLCNAQGDYPNLGKIAERLHMSSRTLKRKLKEHGSTFQQILEETRRAEGVRLLRATSLSAEQIAERLGYSDPSNFCRAFRKWAPASPHAFREKAPLQDR